MDLGPLTACTALVELDVNYWEGLSDVSAPRSCRGLTALDMSYNPPLTDITPITALLALKILKMPPDDVACKDLSPLSACTALVELHIAVWEALTVISALQWCSGLTSLTLQGCNDLVDLTPLASCCSLTHANISNTGVIDLSPLASCPALTFFGYELVERCAPPAAGRTRGALVTCHALYHRPRHPPVGGVLHHH